MKKIILIGGAPTTGKSTIAKQLSKEYNLPWLSTDQFRTIVRSISTAKNAPALFTTSSHTAESFLTRFTSQQIVDHEIEEGIEVWPAIRAFIENDYVYSDGFIIEGVHILPSLIAKDCQKNPRVQTIFLTDDNEDRISAAIYKRGLWDDAQSYADSLKEKEVEWVKIFTSYIQAEALKYSFSTVAVEKNEHDIEKVQAIIL